MAEKKTSYPNYLAAINRKRKRVFVLAPPNLCAIRIGGVWQYTTPLSDREMEEYELVVDLELAMRFIAQAKEMLEEKKIN